MAFPKATRCRFARLVYVSSWIKCHHPAVFACALLNSQPMGFYAPGADRARCARASASRCAPIDVNASGWDNSAGARRARRGSALRLGFRQIDGFRDSLGRALMVAAHAAAAASPASRALARRADLPPRALRLLADADAFGSLGLDRRRRLWEVRRTPGRRAAAVRRRGGARTGRRARHAVCRSCAAANRWWPITRRCACR